MPLRVSLSPAERPPEEQHPFGYGKERFLEATPGRRHAAFADRRAGNGTT